eukprot:4031026-Alexandrium_andersonii.AAC.1
MRAVTRPKRPQFPRLLARLADRGGDVRVRAISLPTRQFIDEDTRGVRMRGPHPHRDVRVGVQRGM